MQSSFSELEYAAKKKLTRRDRFLAEIEAVRPWSTLVAEIEPPYPKGEDCGRPPIGLERMLRIYVAQQCFGLSDEGIENAVYDSEWHFGMKAHIGVDADSDLAHTLVGTAANVAKATEAHALLHGDETDVVGNAGY